MVSSENKNNAYAKFGGTNKEYYGIFRSWLLIANGHFLMWFVFAYDEWHNQQFLIECRDTNTRQSQKA